MRRYHLSGSQSGLTHFFAGAIRKWRAERGKGPSLLWSPPCDTAGPPSGHDGPTCERIVVLNKRDLVPGWGMEVCIVCPVNVAILKRGQPFRRAMAARFPEQIVHFASCNRHEDIKSLSRLLVSMSRRLLPVLFDPNFYHRFRHSQKESTCHRNQCLGGRYAKRWQVHTIKLAPEFWHFRSCVRSAFSGALIDNNFLFRDAQSFANIRTARSHPRFVKSVEII